MVLRLAESYRKVSKNPRFGGKVVRVINQRLSMSPILLPDDFRNSHEYAISVHDEIVELVKAGAEQGVWGQVGLQIRPEHDATALAPLEGEALWDWLEEHGYQDTLDEMAMRNTAGAVSSDFCNFVLEALQCSEKGKLTVSYALLRKPFRESLYILEWMLADRAAFLSAFHSMEAEPLSVGTAYRQQTLLSTIERAASQTETTSALPAQFLFDLRYNRTAPFGFEPLWNQALHLVTTKNFCRTTRQNLNFVFSDSAALLSQWHHLYRTAPLLINYAREVIELLLQQLGGQSPDVNERALIRMAGGALWASEMAALRESDGAGELPSLELPEFSLPCVRCREFYELSLEDFSRLFYQKHFKCPNCGRTWSLKQILEPVRTLRNQHPLRSAWEWLRDRLRRKHSEADAAEQGDAPDT